MRGLIVTAVVLAAAVGAYGIYQKRSSKAPEAKYTTQVVDTGTVMETVTATGTIAPVNTVQVGSQVSGIVSKLYVDFNSPVKKGQLLAELDPTPFVLQVQQRQADLQQTTVQMSNAKIQLDRNARLLAQQLVAQADYDTAKATYDGMKAQVDQSEAALKQAETNLGYAKIFSPIDGVVVARQYDIGQTVAASFQAPTLFTIAEDLTKMQVKADVDQSDISRVTNGQTSRFTVDAYPEEPFTGKISQIRLNATVNQNVITYPVIIDVPNPDGRLKPNMTADVTIEVARVADVLRIPNAALRFKPIEVGRAGGGETATKAAVEGNPPRGAARAGQALGGGPRPPKHQQTVYVVLADNKLKPVEVKTGISDGRFTAVTDGELKAGDKIAIGFMTAKADQQGASPMGMGGGPRPGGGGGGRRP